MKIFEKCFVFRGDDLKAYYSDYFSQNSRRILCIGGSGFDPRSVSGGELLSECRTSRIDGILLREVRPNPSSKLVSLAAKWQKQLEKNYGDCEILDVEIFSSDDGGVVGGRRAIKLLSETDLSLYDDVILDISALSSGVWFPVGRYLFEAARSKQFRNFHIFVAESAELDARIVRINHDAASLMHGFRGSAGIDGLRDAVKLWIPQLMRSQESLLERLSRFKNFDDVCPMIPISGSDLRLPESLVNEYRIQLETWDVDFRSLLYVSEDDPMDVFRKVRDLKTIRDRVFTEVGGSQIFLSPTGSKILTIGFFMAAVAFDMPVTYVESEGYEYNEEEEDLAINKRTELTHLWLAGDAYPDSWA